jgi:hypothetical protein
MTARTVRRSGRRDQWEWRQRANGANLKRSVDLVEKAGPTVVEAARSQLAANVREALCDVADAEQLGRRQHWWLAKVAAKLAELVGPEGDVSAAVERREVVMRLRAFVMAVENLDKAPVRPAVELQAVEGRFEHVAAAPAGWPTEPPNIEGVLALASRLTAARSETPVK